MKLNLGCGRHPLPAWNGWTNVDIRELPGVDQVVDLDQPWPWQTGTIQTVRISHVLEHVEDVTHWMDESWRVLRPHGTLEIFVPHYRHQNAYTDPTHRRFFTEESITYYTGEGTHDTYTTNLWNIVRGPILYGGKPPRGLRLVSRYFGFKTHPVDPDEIYWLLQPQKETKTCKSA